MPETQYRNDANHCERMAAIMLSKAQRDSYLQLAVQWRKLADDSDAHRLRVETWTLKTRRASAAADEAAYVAAGAAVMADAD
jgi:hypothetical protein